MTCKHGSKRQLSHGRGCEVRKSEGRGGGAWGCLLPFCPSRHNEPHSNGWVLERAGGPDRRPSTWWRLWDRAPLFVLEDSPHLLDPTNWVMGNRAKGPIFACILSKGREGESEAGGAIGNGKGSSHCRLCMWRRQNGVTNPPNPPTHPPAVASVGLLMQW